MEYKNVYRDIVDILEARGELAIREVGIVSKKYGMGPLDPLEVQKLWRAWSEFEAIARDVIFDHYSQFELGDMGSLEEDQ